MKRKALEIHSKNKRNKEQSDIVLKSCIYIVLSLLSLSVCFPLSLPLSFFSLSLMAWSRHSKMKELQAKSPRALRRFGTQVSGIQLWIDSAGGRRSCPLVSFHSLREVGIHIDLTVENSWRLEEQWWCVMCKQKRNSQRATSIKEGVRSSNEHSPQQGASGSKQPTAAPSTQKQLGSYLDFFLKWKLYRLRTYIPFY